MSQFSKGFNDRRNMIDMQYRTIWPSDSQANVFIYPKIKCRKTHKIK